MIRINEKYTTNKRIRPPAAPKMMGILFEALLYCLICVLPLHGVICLSSELVGASAGDVGGLAGSKNSMFHNELCNFQSSTRLLDGRRSLYELCQIDLMCSSQETRDKSLQGVYQELLKSRLNLSNFFFKFFVETVFEFDSGINSTLL